MILETVNKHFLMVYVRKINLIRSRKNTYSLGVAEWYND